MNVIAVARGYDGLCVREPDAVDEDGQAIVFQMPDGSTGDWFVEVDEKGQPLRALPKKKKDSGPPPGAGPAKGSQTPVKTSDLA